MKHYLFEGLDNYVRDLRDEDNKKVKRIVKDITWDEDDDDEYIDSTYHDYSEDELEAMGAFDNLHDDDEFDESLNEDTVKRNDKWVNVGKDGKADSGKFTTKKEADAQRKAMFANGYKGESLEEETNMDKINKYLKSINEKPITEAKEEKEIKKPQEPASVKGPIRDKDGKTNMDKIHSLLGESKSNSTKSMNLYENINKGFERLYGDLDSNKSNAFRKPLTESKNESKEVDRKSLKEYKDLGQDLGEYQKYVDADMKEHGHISKKTMEEIKKAGLSVVKDQYGQYEVIAKEKDHLAETKNESKKPASKKKSREEIVEAYRRNLRKRKLAEAMARKREERKNK